MRQHRPQTMQPEQQTTSADPAPLYGRLKPETVIEISFTRTGHIQAVPCRFTVDELMKVLPFDPGDEPASRFHAAAMLVGMLLWPDNTLAAIGRELTVADATKELIMLNFGKTEGVKQ